MQCFLSSFSSIGFPQIMNRQTDNGHFPPTVVSKGHCELRTIISTVLKASFETTDLSLLAGGCKKNIRNVVFGEKWGAWIIDEPLLAMFGPPVQSGANGYRCLWFPSNCFTWELNSNAERVGIQRKGDEGMKLSPEYWDARLVSQSFVLMTTIRYQWN